MNTSSGIPTIWCRAAEFRHVSQGPLSDYLDLYAERLIEAGFARMSIRRRLWAVVRLGHYLENKRLSVRQLDEQIVASYLRVYRRYGVYERITPAALSGLLALLRKVGACCPRPATRLTRAQQIIAEFRRHLLDERSLAERTITRHISVARLLDHWRSAHRRRWSTLTPGHVADFVQDHILGLHRGYAAMRCDSLRAFFRYLHLSGEITTDLTIAVPGIAPWRLATLPFSLSPMEIRRVLSHCDRKTALGRRDYAILSVLAHLGLRACEILTLTLDDIDWQAGLLHLRRTKGGGVSTFPLPKSVGQAIASYLKNGRPHSASRVLFLRGPAPHQGLRDSSSVVYVVKSALRRAQARVPRGAAHLFRHSLAIRMLRNGASLRSIGDLLRHQDPDTTRVYAWVDLARLRPLALPWPGGVP